MNEPSTRPQESTRPAPEATTRRPAAAEAARDAATVAGQVAGLGDETLTVLADAAQHAFRNVIELSNQASQEGARQLTEWQQTNLELMREMQGAALGWATLWPEYLRDPVRGYQRSLEQSIQLTQRLVALTRRNAETLAQACQRLERATDNTTRSLGETFRDASTKMHDAQARAERTRAA
jgi:hypothetical protein